MGTAGGCGHDDGLIHPVGFCPKPPRMSQGRSSFLFSLLLRVWILSVARLFDGAICLELELVQSLILGLQLGILSLQGPYPIPAGCKRLLVVVENPQVFLIALFGSQKLSIHPCRRQPIQIRTGMPVGTFKSSRRIGMSRHAYRFSRFRISQLILERFWRRSQSSL